MASPLTGEPHPFFRIQSSAWVNVVALTAAEELVMMGLRLNEGISLSRWRALAPIPDVRIAELEEMGLLVTGELVFELGLQLDLSFDRCARSVCVCGKGVGVDSHLSFFLFCINPGNAGSVS